MLNYDYSVRLLILYFGIYLCPYYNVSSFNVKLLPVSDDNSPGCNLRICCQLFVVSTDNHVLTKL